MNIPNKIVGKSKEKWVRRLFLALAVLLGFLQAWASRMDLISDTVSYLDIGDGIWSGHWSMAINGLWGPLYAVILGAATKLLRPSLHWEYPLVHFVVLVIFLVALCGFDFFLRELILLRRERESNNELSIPAWVWLTVGYTIFLWTSLLLIGVSETNPDMLVAVFFYFACGFLVKIRRHAAGWPAYLYFGLVLGLGYLTKVVMFPISLSFLAALFIVEKKQLWHAAGATAVFVVLSGPFITSLSREKGRVTFGESGRYNYAVHVNHVPRTHWQGETPGSGKPLHASRQIFDRPATFEFGEPLDGTYPAWTDPSYWYDGVQAPVNLHRALRTEVRLLGVETLFFFELHGALIATLFVLFYVGARKWSVLQDLFAYWFLLLPSIGALCLYALVHIEPRYLAPFIAVFLLSFYFSVHLPVSRESRRLTSAVALFLFFMFVCPIESPSMHLRGFIRDITGRSTPNSNSYQAVASEMRKLGLQPGDSIASLQYSLWGTSTWARLAGVKIVAEVYYWHDLPESAANDFWKADPITQAKVIQAIEKTGARIIVSQERPDPSYAPGWERVGNTNYYAYWLVPQTQEFPLDRTRF
jgi:hypothetical protein